MKFRNIHLHGDNNQKDGEIDADGRVKVLLWGGNLWILVGVKI